MTLPGVSILTRETTTPPTSVTDTGQAFMVGFAGRGIVTGPMTIRNMNDYLSNLGLRTTYGYLYDALQAFFAEGGTVAYVSRILGPTPVLATVKVFDQSGSADPGDVALVATAKEYGDWANGLNVVVVYTGPTYTIHITHDTDSSVDVTSDALTTQADGVAFSNDYITFTAGASNQAPRSGSYNLAGGDDDHGNATQTTRRAALARFSKAMGPGQVLAPGITTQTCHEDLLDHAYTMNRRALLDAPDSGTAATVYAAADAVDDYGTTDGTRKYRLGFMCAPWGIIPGLTVGTTRDCPYSAIQAGVIARNDGAGLAPNDNAAGITNGRARYAVGLKHGPDTDGTLWTDTELETLNDHGVNLARIIQNGVTTYGIRTLADPDSEPTWVNFGNGREIMLITALGEAIGERYLFRTIDGRRLLFAELKGDLMAMLELERKRNALYGPTPGEAYAVDTGDAVNTSDTIAARQIRALMAVRFSEAGEEVIIEIAKVPVDQAVA